MPLIALTGGIASGKSTISRRLAELGATVVDADVIVREVQQPGSPVLAAIAKRFGGEMIQEDGTLDRARLGATVFGHLDALSDLNRIVHPAVRAESKRRFDAAFAADPRAVVVYDVPLLAEARGTAEWDLVVVADAPAEQRIQRLVDLRGMSEADARRRVASQSDDGARRALANVVIDTSGSEAHTVAQTNELWTRVTAAR